MSIVLVGDRARIRNVALQYDAEAWEMSITEPGYGIFDRFDRDVKSSAASLRHSFETE